MPRPSLLLLVACALLTSGAGPRPRVDESAIRDALSLGSAEGESFASSSSYAHFLAAQLLHHEGDLRGSIDELRLALASDVDNPFLLVTLAEQYGRLGDLRRAERELRRVIERRPGYAPAQLMMGRVLLEGHKLARARIHLRKAVELRPKDVDAYLVLTQVALESGDVAEAVKVVEAIAKALPGESVGHRRLGLVLAERGDHARAERLLGYAADVDPQDPEVWVALGRLHEATGRAEKAAEAFGRALEHEPDSREVLLEAGRLALKLHRRADAKAYFDRLLSLGEDPELAVKVAFAYVATRQSTAALEVLDSARQRYPDEPRIAFYSGLVAERMRQWAKAEAGFALVPPTHELFLEARAHRATCLSNLARHAEAIALFEATIKERPDDVQALAAYAQALERIGRARDAEVLLRGAVDRRHSPELLDALAGLYERQGRAAEAISFLTEALAKRPRDEALLFILGATHERQGDSGRSIARMREVLKVNPDNAAALNFIGYTLADQGRDFDEAERLLRRALELRPDSGAYLDSLGWVFFRRGEFDRAVATLERAEQLAPEEPLISEHLGDAYHRAGRESDAARAYRRALDQLAISDGLDQAGMGSAAQRKLLEQKLKLLSTGAASR